MSDRNRLIVLILVMSVIVFTVTGAALGLLYGAAFREERTRLVEAAQSQARLMEAVARFDHKHSLDYPGGEHAASMNQFRDAHEHYRGFGKTGEFTLASRNGDSIEFLFRHRHSGLDKPAPVPFGSELAEPMRRALSGQSGSVIGLDYRGVRVLAAYEPVAILDLGIVAKIDLAEVRAPFIRAGVWVIVLAFVLISFGAVLILKLTTPLMSDLKERERQLNLILASTDEGIIGADGSGRCLFANRACAKLLGYESDRDLIGNNIHALVHAGQPCTGTLGSLSCPVRSSLGKRDHVALAEEKLYRADGSSFAATYRSVPMILNGLVVGSVVTFDDITERKQREAQLHQAQKLEVVGQLTGGIAHDFNNLLTIILGNLRFVSESASGEMETGIKEALEDALEAAQDGAALVERLLGFGRKQELTPQSIEIREFLQKIGWLLRRILGTAIDLQIDTPEDAFSVRTDPRQLENAILNLALNARDAMPEGGVLSIKGLRASMTGADIGSEPDAVLIEVTDHGTGMSAADAAKAIEPFYTTKEPGKGTGLGLSMAYGFAEQSGGSLHLESAVGHGTTVRLRLPLAPPRHRPCETATAPTGFKEGSEVVLVVEDQIRVLALASRHLRQLGYRVVEACGPEAAQRILMSEQPIDLLFTDIAMPGTMNGYELAAWAVQQRPTLKVLLTTGFAMDSGSDRGGAAPRWPVLKKPYTKQTLAKAARGVLDNLAPSTEGTAVKVNGSEAKN